MGSEHAGNAPTQPNQIVNIRLVNSRSTSVDVYIEPWGDVHTMPPGATFSIVVRGPADDCLEVEDGDDRITLWGWSGSVVQVFHDGTELGSGLWPRPPAPPTPG